MPVYVSGSQLAMGSAGRLIISSKALSMPNLAGHRALSAVPCSVAQGLDRSSLLECGFYPDPGRLPVYMPARAIFADQNERRMAQATFVCVFWQRQMLLLLSIKEVE